MLEKLATAVELAPVLERVHGANHPELTQVRVLTEQIAKSTDVNIAAGLFAQLRDITDSYTVPSDGCEAYVATYKSLQEAETAQASN